MSKTKRLRNPTRAQKVIMTAAGLEWKNWYVQGGGQSFSYGDQ